MVDICYINSTFSYFRFIYAIVNVILIILMSIPFCVLNTRARNSFCDNWKVLRPYMWAPTPHYDKNTMGDIETETSRFNLSPQFGVGYNFGDFIVALMHVLNRQGISESIFLIPNMCVIMMLIKYCLLTNPFIHKLSVLYINQWSDRIDANWDGETTESDYDVIKKTLVKLFGHTIVDEVHAKILDSWRFCGNFPIPDKRNKTKTVTGIQFSGADTDCCICVQSLLPS
eukprot:UN33360